jgi:hypothetical protein
MRRGPGLMGTAARTAVVAGTATAVSGKVARRQAGKAADEAAERQAQAAPPQAAPSPPEAPAAPAADEDVIAQLQKLADLHAAGALTDEEFASMKAKLLA